MLHPSYASLYPFGPDLTQSILYGERSNDEVNLRNHCLPILFTVVVGFVNYTIFAEAEIVLVAERHNAISIVYGGSLAKNRRENADAPFIFVCTIEIRHFVRIITQVNR